MSIGPPALEPAFPARPPLATHAHSRSSLSLAIVSGASAAATTASGHRTADTAKLISASLLPTDHSAAKAMTFAKASTAIADRATDLLRSELFVGGFTINKSKKIRPAYLPREVTFTRADDTEETYFLVQSSNDARKVRPLLYPRSIVHNVVVPIAGLTDIPDAWAKNVGEVFTVAELAAKCKPAAEALPAKTGSWRIAILPAVFAFPGNEDSGYGGVVDEGCMDFFESIHAHASFWPRHIADHVPAFQRAVLASYEGDKKVLGKCFPTLARKDCRLFTRTPNSSTPTEVARSPRHNMSSEVLAVTSLDQGGNRP